MTVERLSVEILKDRSSMGEAAAAWALRWVRQGMEGRGRSRIIIGTGASQTEVIAALVRDRGIDWNRVEVFHMDEYVGIAASHPASFRRWLRTHVADRVDGGTVHYLAGDAPDVETECRRYADLLAAGPIDVCFAGFGENGHIAFNDPHEARFDDPFDVRMVELDARCRAQQVADGCFPDIGSVPERALTITCPLIMRSLHLVASVPGGRKAQAVRDALLGPVDTACPASITRTHPSAALFLDLDSATLLH